MISQGDDAPRFELPALMSGSHRRLALDEYLGEDIVVLAFYPGDFNPACDEESDLDELDLFTMQKDVTVLGVSPDSLYSHAAFADEYDLHVPLLSDTRRAVAEDYGVTFEDDVGQELVERAVFVIDHDGVVAYAWCTQDMLELPPVDEIKDAIAETGGDDTAFARYRIGHAHYNEGRRAFTSAMSSFQDSEWMLSQGDFKQAKEEFEEAAEHFDSSIRFVDDEEFEAYYELAKEKATALWQAADWLTDSASAYSSGSGAEGQRLRDDAERPLESARDIGEPVDPDDWPPDFDVEEEESTTILPQEDETDTELAVDIDEAATGDADDGASEASTTDADDGDTDDGDTGDAAATTPETAEGAVGGGRGDDPDGDGVPAGAGGDVTDAAAGNDGDGADATTGRSGDDADPEADSGDADEIDDEELEAIEAELAASQPENPAGEELEEDPTSMVDAPPGDLAGESDGGDEHEADSDEHEADSGDIEGEVGADDLEQLEADLEASQSAAEEARRKREEAAEAEAAEKADDGEETDAGDPLADEASDGGDLTERSAGDDQFGLEGGSDDADADGGLVGEPAADPTADLSGDGRDVPPPGSGSLEPSGGGSSDDGLDEFDDPDEGPELDDEPRGASDDDLDAIPTTEDLTAQGGDGEDDSEASEDENF